MKIRPVGAEFFHAEFRDKRTDMVKLTVAFHSFVNIPKTRTARQRARDWLRNCTANRNVADLIPDGVTGIFHWLNPPDLTMPLGSTRSLTGISTLCTCDYRCNFTGVYFILVTYKKIYLQYWEKCINKIEIHDLF